MGRLTSAAQSAWLCSKCVPSSWRTNSVLAARILEARRVFTPTSALSAALVYSSRPLHSGAAAMLPSRMPVSARSNVFRSTVSDGSSSSSVTWIPAFSRLGDQLA